MPRLLKAIALLPALLVGGCNAADLVNALVSHDDFRRTSGVPYGPGPRRTLDVYRSPGGDGRPKPVVVFFYGGNWQTGDKADYLFVGEALASRGFVVVIPDYRLYPEVRYPDFLKDGAAAVSYTLNHAADWDGDPHRVSIVGHSAGAYIVAMLAVDPRLLGADRARVQRVVGLAGPYDFLPLTDPTLKIIFGTGPDLTPTQPILYADGTAPPLLLMAGVGDKTVDPDNVTRLAARIREKGGQVETRFYPRIGHITLIGAAAQPLRFLAPVLDDVADFLRR